MEHKDTMPGGIEVQMQPLYQMPASKCHRFQHKEKELCTNLKCNCRLEQEVYDLFCLSMQLLLPPFKSDWFYVFLQGHVPGEQPQKMQVRRKGKGIKVQPETEQN
ncbi:uncharacterized protein LOC105167816 [Sesamum indicum]|uniref:Uncharacterized protein LOC105167816 n=1 Tax=Sesamum indicum TaxID=4182 RepID=A0A6I9TJH1_SESIN|nr:uncharacterized protein LOC105167816 [Sesamum indicum]